MADAIAVVNAGSSSIKFSLFAAQDGELELKARGQIQGIHTAPHFIAKDSGGALVAENSWGDGVKLGHADALDHLMGFVRGEFGQLRLAGVGHRVVHGGTEYGQPVRVDAKILSALEKYVPWRLCTSRTTCRRSGSCLSVYRSWSKWRASTRPSIGCSRPSRSCSRCQSGLPSAACVATVSTDCPTSTSHRRFRNTTRWLRAARRSCCTSATVRACARSPAGEALRAPWASLRSTGCRWGRAAAVSDPGVMLYLMDELKMDTRTIERLIYQQSGLLGVSGVSSDMRTLEASVEPDAKIAIELFAYRIGRELGSLAAALGGVDAIVFTAGIGENSRSLREHVCKDAAWLGIELDTAANQSNASRISTPASRVAAWVIPTNEELMIARHTQALLSAATRQRTITSRVGHVQ